ncbi:hypothetical protein K469DRAFT_136357 [Zopfia rhizophila CBS 207.26]|uniref:Protein SMG7 n=1 Tax=Zopfia rhizophila CBS 207.26 TaxID=1314779 RepID=A0A6A6EV30_9PEZI|nr:hypothetical protein K469DRAFT_136357 [Zopfia rhizophila CBS 207.26]
MAANIEQLVGRAHAIEKEIAKLEDSNASGADLAALLQEYRVACENVIFNDFEFASAKGIETQLWAAHLKINGIFRKELRHVRRIPTTTIHGHRLTDTHSQLRRNGKDRVVEYRKLGKHYLQFIKASQRFYRQYILNLDTQLDGIPELRKIAHKWKDDATKTSFRKRIPSSLKNQVLLSCHQALIQLGDLSRYRETELVEKDRNWGPAKGYYGLAEEIYPDSGHSHNQLAVIAREDGNHFRSTYHLYRSLASKQPHPHAKPNLELEFKKIISAWSKGELINNHRSSDGNTPGRALVAWFIRLHSKCYKGLEFTQHDELENEVLSQLAIELKERSLDGILQKIILINIAAEYFSTVQMQDPKPPENIFRTYFYYLRLNVKTFFTLLQVLQPELERLTEGDDVTNQNDDRVPQLSDKITIVARRILPGLRLYSTWFTRFWHVLNANIADTLTTVEVQELWKAYAATLTLLASTFPAHELPKDEYMLEEDAESIGFQPLIVDATRKMWYIDDGDVLKPKWSDLERNHPNIEMLMRIRDLLIDGLNLTQNPEAPLDLDGLRFIYREAGLPSELLASPNNRPDGSPVIPPEHMDFPLFPQDTPLPDDQKSHSVAAHSESASTALAKDSAMNRMVDDLVGPDDGLDPLPEEDENIPPTPPEQTFEDSMMVKDTSYGVQSYPKPVGSPATPVFATPMNRVASSSSIRQPANLPSLPDGQYNGNSIWNPNYNGTPGPSSPLLGNGNAARGSPLSGLHAPGASGHARGDSSHSLRSSDYTFPSATPAQRPISGGLGSGAVWGNPNASYYGSIYGHSYTQNGNTTDMNLMSPFLFGKATWSSGLERGNSSYGRTPPNGQGG